MPLLKFVLLAAALSTTPAVGVGPQYGSTHVYVSAKSFDRFVASFIATFGGTASTKASMTVTPTPSKTFFQAIATPVGLISAFGYQTPIPYPFGAERSGYLVTDIDAALRAARSTGAAVVVAPFDDPIGKDVIVAWPGGPDMQLYWHTVTPHANALQTVPEGRVYISPDEANQFVRDFTAFAHGNVESDVTAAPGIEIGRPSDTYRRVRISSAFGKLTVIVSDGHLPYPYGRETTAYHVADLTQTLRKAESAGATVLVKPYVAAGRVAAIVQFPGGYIAEVYSLR